MLYCKLLKRFWIWRLYVRNNNKSKAIGYLGHSDLIRKI